MRPRKRSQAQEQGDSMVGISDECTICHHHVMRSESQVISGSTTKHWECAHRREEEIADMTDMGSPGPEGY